MAYHEADGPIYCREPGRGEHFYIYSKLQRLNQHINRSRLLLCPEVVLSGPTLECSMVELGCAVSFAMFSHNNPNRTLKSRASAICVHPRAVSKGIV